jgi:hypothetical protein
MATPFSASAPFRCAIARIDEANSADPNVILLKTGPRPKELAHAELLTAWVQRLRPDASEALLLAARAQHIRRWEIPRASYPAGRQGYLRWRRALQDFHAAEAGRILAECGYDAATISRVKQLIHKQGLGRDPDVQALEDGLCLVFFETQFTDLRSRMDSEKLVDVLRKTWRKMSPEGQRLARSLPLDAADRELLERALAV